MSDSIAGANILARADLTQRAKVFADALNLAPEDRLALASRLIESVLESQRQESRIRESFSARRGKWADAMPLTNADVERILDEERARKSGNAAPR